MKQLLTRSKHFHNLSHSSVSAGDALRVMTRENLAVKTLNSVIDGKKSNSATDEENKEIEKINHSWAFNFKQLLDPAGIRFKPGILQQPRPVYHAKERKFSRHAVYKRVNPKTNETETRIMPGERGRAKWGDWFISNITLGFKRLYTKKTGVSLAPKDGTMAFFTRGDDDPIGLGFNITMLDIKDEKYVFEYDGDTNAKWWWHFRYVAYSKDPNLSYIIKKCITIQELKNINRALRRRGEVPRYNEILACLTAEALVAVVVSKDILSFRINSIFRKMIIKHKLGIDLPILMMGMLFNGNSTITTREYTVEEQIFDLFDLSTNSTYETESIFDAVAKQYNEKHKAKSPDSKKDFVKTLVNTHPVNWATLFNDRQVSSVKEKNFKQFINDATGIDLDKKVDYKPMGTHLSTCVT